MRLDHAAFAVVALALGLAALAVQTTRAAAPANVGGAISTPSPPFAFVDSCGMRFVEMAPHPPPDRMTWAEFGAPFDAAFGVTAFAHGAEGDPRRENAGGLYQCTELVHRYLRQVHGVPTRIGLGLGHGVDLARGLADRFGAEAYVSPLVGSPVSLTFFRNGASACRPTVGGIVSIAMAMPDGAPTPGHVAVIRTLEPAGDTALEATLFEQHGGSSLTPGQEIGAGRIRFERRDGAWSGVFLSQGGRSFPVEGWTNLLAR